MEIYLVSKLWTDSLENYNASGYAPEGFCFTKERADELVKEAGTFKDDFWAVSKGTPMRIVEKIKVL